MNHAPLYTDVKIKKLEHSEYEIRGELPLTAVAAHRPNVLRALGKDITLPGFRKGHIPEKVLVERVGEETILREIAEEILREAYPKITAERGLRVIGRPEVTLTKIAPDNPIGFLIKTAVAPDIVLPDYKAIAAAARKGKDFAEPAVVTTEELDRAIELLVTRRADQSTRSAGSKTEEKAVSVELTDDVVKTLGNFKDVADFKKQLQESLLAQKQLERRSKQRALIGERVVEGATISLPRILVKHELAKMVAQLRHDVEHRGGTFETYLKQIRKTESDIRNEWKDAAERRAKLQLALNEIARIEDIRPERNEVEREVEHILSHAKDADRTRARVYAESVLRNEKVFQFLESADVGEKPEDKTPE